MYVLDTNSVVNLFFKLFFYLIIGENTKIYDFLQETVSKTAIENKLQYNNKLCTWQNTNTLNKKTNASSSRFNII